MKKQDLILIGGGGHCKSCVDVIEKENKFFIKGILDLPEKIGEKVLDYFIIGSDVDIEELSRSYQCFLITIGHVRSPEKRIHLFNKLIKLGITLPTIISPLSYVSKYAIIGKGTIVLHHALVNSGAVVGDNCIINTKALIEHDAIIGNHCHISTGSIINGTVKVGQGTFYGSGAVCRESLTIPEFSFIKANSIIK
jgi:sugar O-acyltransferase (sialic acid O-acetyltransferase NeuD family)